MDTELLILYIEDNPDDAELVKRALKKAGLVFKMEVVDNEADYITALTLQAPDLILSDHSIPGFSSLMAFKVMTRVRTGTPFILLTGTVTEQFAIDCLLAGIDDYILKDNLIRLPSCINRVLSKKQISIEKELIQSLNTQLQEKNKEITDSINYAKRIQDAILPYHDQVCRDFSDGFIMFKPRNIVSGDLYWLASTTTTDSRRLSLKIVAAIDCTGHGVPGAFMSLLVSELLNQTLKNPNINSPGDVLSYLNHKLPVSLNRNQKERITDGLDIVLCAIDQEQHIAYFSGANRPLWVIRHNGECHELIEYKGTKASIGEQTPADQVFENNIINLLPGDRLFLFSDGITDQFGGLRGKKLGKQGLREVLLKSANLPMHEQKEYIERFFYEWKGELDQVDDVLIIGVGID